MLLREKIAAPAGNRRKTKKKGVLYFVCCVQFKLYVIFELNNIYNKFVFYVSDKLQYYK